MTRCVNRDVVHHRPRQRPRPVLIADICRKFLDYEPGDEICEMNKSELTAVLDSFAITHEALRLVAVDAGHDLDHYLEAAAGRL
jgi:hypothetical protein